MGSVPPFELAAAGTGRYALSGAMVLANAVAVLERGERAFGELPEVTVDLGGVSHVDSGGLAVLLEWLRGARKAGRKLHYAALPPQLLAIARLCGTEEILLERAPPAG